jgi:hypothetical protein
MEFSQMTPTKQFVIIRLRLLKRSLKEDVALTYDLIKICLIGFDGM